MMNITEYLTIVQEQISNKSAKKLIERELSNHVSEQKDAYIEFGMSEKEAEAEAIRQMGDPIKTGYELNRLHKPQMPYGMLIIFIVLSVMGILVQFIIFSATGMQGNYEGKTICYHLLSFLIVLLMLYVDYSFFVRYVSWLAAFWMLAVWLADNALHISLIQSMLAGYYLMLCFPIPAICIFYKKRETGVMGIVKTMFFILAGVFWHVWWSKGRLAGIFEAVITIYTVMCIMIVCGVYERKASVTTRMKYLLILWLPILFLAMAVIIMDMGGDCYVWSRMEAIWNPEAYREGMGYAPLRIRDWNKNFSMWGNQELFMDFHWALHTDYMINSIFSYFGVAAGVIVLLIYVCLLVKAFQMSIKQKNRLGYAIGLVSTVCLLIRVSLCVASNFGWIPRFTTSMPFLSYGFVNALADGIYMGLLCSVFRNTKILPEPQAKYLRPRYEIRIVKNQFDK